jgi:hypothetical protein
VTNDGTITLHNASVSDLDGVVTIAGFPVASLAPSASDGNYTAEYTITATDVGLGFFEHDVVAVADEASASSGTVTVMLPDLLLLV